jgi:hypothetical protein
MPQEPDATVEPKVTTTITLPASTAADVKEAAARAGIGWTQMMAVLIRQALDENRARGAK